MPMSPKEDKTWIYDGPPDNIGLLIPDADPADGGYVLLTELDNGVVRMFATRFPGRCVASWMAQIRRFGGAKPGRVLVSSPHLLYERIKRMVVEDVGVANAQSIEQYKRKTNELFAIEPLNVKGASQRLATQAVELHAASV